MDIYKFIIDNEPYEVEVISIDKEKAEVTVNGLNYQVELDNMEYVRPTSNVQSVPMKPKKTEKTKSALAERSVTPQPGLNKNEITAPMPGAIAKIMVAEGDSFKAGDVLLTIEAMKMENQIKANSDGVAKKIHVKKGDTVSEGSPLISLG